MQHNKHFGIWNEVLKADYVLLGVNKQQNNKNEWQLLLNS